MSYDTHLTESDLDRLLHERTSTDATRAAHHHLWLCRECRERLLEHDEAALYLEEVYGAGTAATWRRTVEEPVDLLSYAVDRSSAIRGLSAAHLRMKTVSNAAQRDLATFAVTIETGYALRKDDPAGAKSLLEGVFQALEDRHDWPQEARDPLRARALAYHGNACRILSEREAAKASFAKVREYLLQAPESGLAGLVALFEGNLNKDVGDYPAAFSKLEDAMRLLPPTGEALTRLEAGITLANTYGLAGNWAKNVETLRTLVEEHPPSAFPAHAYLPTLQSLTVGYALLGQPKKAEELLPEVRRLAEAEGNRLDLVRVDWAEAEVLKAQGKRTLAAARFREVTSKFMAAEIPVDAALAALSQAEMYLDLGDTKAAARLAEVLVPIFHSKGIHREAGAAGLIVVEDLRREAATAGQVQELVERLQGVGARRPPSRTSSAR